jgi:hypothetical protein
MRTNAIEVKAGLPTPSGNSVNGTPSDAESVGTSTEQRSAVPQPGELIERDITQ